MSDTELLAALKRLEADIRRLPAGTDGLGPLEDNGSPPGIYLDRDAVLALIQAHEHALAEFADTALAAQDFGDIRRMVAICSGLVAAEHARSAIPFGQQRDEQAWDVARSAFEERLNVLGFEVSPAAQGADHE